MKNFTCILVGLLALLPGTAGANEADKTPPLTYPKTARVEQTDTYFGVRVPDPFRWLEDDNSPETARWVEAQNKVTFDYLNQIPYRATLKKHLEQLANYPKYSAPFQQNGWVFFYKNDGLQNQSVLYVQKGLEGKPEVLIDPNTFAADGTASLGAFTPSKNARYAAYAVQRSGSDWQEMHVLEIATHKILPDTLKWVKYSSASWSGDGFYYARYPEPESGKELTARSDHQKLYYHRVGTDQADDVLVYQDEARPDWTAGLGSTEDEKWEFLYVDNPKKRGNALFYRPAQSDHQGAFTPIVAEPGEDRTGIVDEVGGKFLLFTNASAPNGKVILFDPKQGDLNKATTILPEKPEPLQSASTAGGKLFARYLKDITSRIYVYSLDGKSVQEVKLPGLGSANGFGGERTDKYVFYTFTSFNYPPTIFRYDIADGKTTLFRAPEIKVDPKAYQVEQAFFKSKDGTRVPMFVISKKGLKKNGMNPTLLYGYGGFNSSETPAFSALRIAWLEQGGVYVVVNLRGGAEYGEQWHRAGMRQNKQNVFDDFIAGAEYLIREKYTSPQKLACQGGSNGGLLVGAVINQRPDLFRAAIPEVGVMDMLRYQNFTAGKFWVAEYGSSADTEQDFKTLFAYSPLHNIKTGATYPATLITTADHDDRVVPAHSFKYVATLQERADSTNPVLIRIETKSGHGSSNLSKAIEKTSDIYAFLFYNLGVTPHL